MLLPPNNSRTSSARYKGYINAKIQGKFINNKNKDGAADEDERRHGRRVRKELMILKSLDLYDRRKVYSIDGMSDLRKWFVKTRILNFV